MSKEEVRQRVEQVWNQLTQRLKEPGIAATNEAQTKAFFITPLFEALWWGDNVNDVELEYPIPKLKDRVDYALKSHGQAVLFVEAKQLGKLDDQQRKQLIERGPHTDVRFGVLTNGKDLEVHDLKYKGEFGGSLLFSVKLDVTDEEFPAQFEKLWLLTKEAWEKGELENYAKRSAALIGIRGDLTNSKSPLQARTRSIMRNFLGRRASVEEVQTALMESLQQIRAVEAVAKPSELTLPAEWDDEELQKYLSSSRGRFPLEYAYYVVLSKHEGMLSLEQLSKALTAHMGKQVDGRNIRGMLGGINVRVEQKMKKERLDVRESRNFGINPKYKSLVGKYLG